MLDEDPPDVEDDPAEEPPDEPPEPPPDGRDTAVPVRSPLAGRDSGRSFACLAHAGLTLTVNAAAAAQTVIARRVIDVLLNASNRELKARFRQNQKAMPLPAAELDKAKRFIDLTREVSLSECTDRLGSVTPGAFDKLGSAG